MSTKDDLSTLLGFLSIFCWLLVLGPQIYRNFKSSNADSLSPYLLLLWLTGDTMNTIGVFLTNQLLFQKISCILFLTMDFLAISQKLYYAITLHAVHLLGLLIRSFFTSAIYSIAPIYMISETTCASAEVIEPLYLYNDNYSYYNDKDVKHNDIGLILGAISSVIYFLSRGPQILKIYNEKQTSLPRNMFVFAILGNLCYSSSLIIKHSDSIESLKIAGPWLAGSIGVMSLDFILLYLVNKYNDDNKIHYIVNTTSDIEYDSTSP